MGYSPWGHKESDTTEHAHKTDCVLLLSIAVCLGFCLLRHEKLTNLWTYKVHSVARGGHLTEQGRGPPERCSSLY